MRGVETKSGNPNVCRDKYGQCNICLCEKKLTWDHVPPKSCYAITPAIQQTLFQNMSSRAGNRMLFSETQNSVKFRTLCSSCNNKLLGNRYDPVLKDFVGSILRFTQTNLAIPTVVKISTKPFALAKAVFGHLLASKGDLGNTEYDKQMRRFFMDIEHDLPEGLNIFYWYYPYELIIVYRDIVMPAIRGRINGQVAGFSGLKFFPVAFLVSDTESYEGLSKIPFEQVTNIEDEVEIPLDLSNPHQERWPEMVDAGNFYAGGKTIESSVIAYDKR